MGETRPASNLISDSQLSELREDVSVAEATQPVAFSYDSPSKLIQTYARHAIKLKGEINHTNKISKLWQVRERTNKITVNRSSCHDSGETDPQSQASLSGSGIRRGCGVGCRLSLDPMAVAVV